MNNAIYININFNTIYSISVIMCLFSRPHKECSPSP